MPEQDMFGENALPLFSGTPVPAKDSPFNPTPKPDPPSQPSVIIIDQGPLLNVRACAPGTYAVTFAEPDTLPGWAVFGAREPVTDWLVWRGVRLSIHIAEVKGVGLLPVGAVITLGDPRKLVERLTLAPLQTADDLRAKSLELALAYATTEAPAWTWEVRQPPEQQETCF